MGRAAEEQVLSEIDSQQRGLGAYQEDSMRKYSLGR